MLFFYGCFGFDLYNYWLFLFKKSAVLSFPCCRFSVRNGVGGAYMVAACAHQALLAPLRMFVNYADVAHGTCRSTLAATDAGIGGAKWLGRSAESVEIRAYYGCFYGGERAGGYLVGHCFAGGDSLGNVL